VNKTQAYLRAKRFRELQGKASRCALRDLGDTFVVRYLPTGTSSDGYKVEHFPYEAAWKASDTMIRTLLRAGYKVTAYDNRTAFVVEGTKGTHTTTHTFRCDQS
jgi:hypothetical protein